MIGRFIQGLFIFGLGSLSKVLLTALLRYPNPIEMRPTYRVPGPQGCPMVPPGTHRKVPGTRSWDWLWSVISNGQAPIRQWSIPSEFISRVASFSYLNWTTTEEDRVTSLTLGTSGIPVTHGPGIWNISKPSAPICRRHNIPPIPARNSTKSSAASLTKATGRFPGPLSACGAIDFVSERSLEWYIMIFVTIWLYLTHIPSFMRIAKIFQNGNI